ncbi:hypothetical protein D3C80_2181310 [compost metagenome]
MADTPEKLNFRLISIISLDDRSLKGKRSLSDCLFQAVLLLPLIFQQLLLNLLTLHLLLQCEHTYDTNYYP